MRQWRGVGGPTNFGCPLFCLSGYVSLKVCLIKAPRINCGLCREEEQNEINNMAAVTPLNPPSSLLRVTLFM